MWLSNFFCCFLLDKDECVLGHDCHKNSTCTNSDGSYICSCEFGYTGDGRTCSNINECAAKENVCHPNAVCVDTVGSHYCVCKDGFTGSGRQCTDVDECEEDVHHCHDNALCVNIPGDVVCKCMSGFVGDGSDCVSGEINSQPSDINCEMTTSASESSLKKGMDRRFFSSVCVQKTPNSQPQIK